MGNADKNGGKRAWVHCKQTLYGMCGHDIAIDGTARRSLETLIFTCIRRDSSWAI